MSNLIIFFVSFVGFLILVILGILFLRWIYKNFTRVMSTEIEIQKLELIKSLYENEKITCEEIRFMNKKDLKVVKCRIEKYYCDLKEDLKEEKFERLLRKRQDYLFKEKNNLYGSLKKHHELLLSITVIGSYTYLVTTIIEDFFKETNSSYFVDLVAIIIVSVVIFTPLVIIIFAVCSGTNFIFGKEEGKNNYDLYDFEIDLIDKYLNSISGNDEDTENLTRNKISRHERIRCRKMYRA